MITGIHRESISDAEMEAGVDFELCDGDYSTLMDCALAFSFAANSLLSSTLMVPREVRSALVEKILQTAHKTLE